MHPDDIVVFQIVSESACSECGEELYRGACYGSNASAGTIGGREATGEREARATVSAEVHKVIDRWRGR